MNKWLLLIAFVSALNIQAQFDNKQIDKIDVVHYRFHIAVNDTTNLISGKTDVSFVRKKPVAQIVLNLKNKTPDGYGMQVKTITGKTGTPLAFTHQNDSLFIQIPYSFKHSDTLQLSIKYEGIPKDGLYIRKNKYGRRTFFGDNWPNRAQYWLPVIDHPSDKAMVTWVVTAPKHYEVVASGRLVKKIPGKQTNRFEYQTQVPIPTKVMVFAAAGFKIKNFDKLYLSETCVPVSSWIYQDSPDTGFDDYKCSLNILKFYDSLIGPYSYQKLANVQSNTRFGGMENAGNIFYDENTVDGTHSVENLVAHEVAHQWFGNSVTEKQWQDIWLSEGFATYLTDLYLEHTYGSEKLKQRMQMERDKVIRFNHLQKKAIVYAENQNLFYLLNPNSYEKGAWVLHMLRIKIGDKSFFKLLKTFYQKYRNRNAGTQDFITLAEKISGKNLQNFFKQWLYRKGVPRLKINGKYDSDKQRYILHIEQKTEVYQLDLPVTLASKTNTYRTVLHLNKRQQDFEIKLPEKFRFGSIAYFMDEPVHVLFELIN